jgi:hypothetical protein
MILGCTRPETHIAGGVVELPPARRASRKDREVAGPLDGEEGLESLYHYSLLQWIGADMGLVVGWVPGARVGDAPFHNIIVNMLNQGNILC